MIQSRSIDDRAKIVQDIALDRGPSPIEQMLIKGIEDLGPFPKCFDQDWIDWDRWSYDEIIIREHRRRIWLNFSALRSDELKKYHIERSRKDFFYWRSNFAYTFDDDRGTIPYLPLAGHDEFQSYLLGLSGHRDSVGNLKNTLLYSSRKRGKTVAYVTPVVWDFLIQLETKHYTITAQQQSSVDNNTFVFSSSVISKIRWMIHRIPNWMRPEEWKATYRAHEKIHREGESRANRFLLLQNLMTGSSIRGATANVNRERGGRGKRSIIDEANSIRQLKALLAALSKVAPWALVSSVEGRYTHFAQLAHGEVVNLGSREKDGLVVLSWHYSEHPLYNPATPEGAARIASEKAQFPSPETWASEMENDFEQSIQGRIWGSDFDDARNIATPEEESYVIDSYHMELYEGWDFGVSSSLTAAVWGYYDDAEDILYIAGLRQWKDGIVEEVARDVANMGYTTDMGGSQEPRYRVGDAAGTQGGRKTLNGRVVSDRSSWIRNLKSVGIAVRGQQLRVETAIDIVRRKLREGKIKLLSRCLTRHPEEPDKFPSMLSVFRGYHRELKGKTLEDWHGDSPRPAKDLYSHAADAVQHISWKIWR